MKKREQKEKESREKTRGKWRVKSGENTNLNILQITNDVRLIFDHFKETIPIVFGKSSNRFDRCVICDGQN